MATLVTVGLDPAQYSDLLSGSLLPENNYLAGNLVSLDPVSEANVKEEAERYIARRAEDPTLRGIVSVQIKGENKAPNLSPPEGIRYTKDSYHSGEVVGLPPGFPVIGTSSCPLTRESQDLDKTWRVDCKVLLHGMCTLAGRVICVYRHLVCPTLIRACILIKHWVRP